MTTAHQSEKTREEGNDCSDSDDLSDQRNVRIPEEQFVTRSAAVFNHQTVLTENLKMCKSLQINIFFVIENCSIRTFKCNII